MDIVTDLFDDSRDASRRRTVAAQRATQDTPLDPAQEHRVVALLDGHYTADDITAIERLKYRYLRTLDTKAWDEFAACFAPDATADYNGLAFDDPASLVAYMRENMGEGVLTMPCGRCRQLLWEHGGASCLLQTPQGVLRMDEVLPQAFGPEDLDRR